VLLLDLQLQCNVIKNNDLTLLRIYKMFTHVLSCSLTSNNLSLSVYCHRYVINVWKLSWEFDDDWKVAPKTDEVEQA